MADNASTAREPTPEEVEAYLALEEPGCLKRLTRLYDPMVGFECFGPPQKPVPGQPWPWDPEKLAS